MKLNFKNIISLAILTQISCFVSSAIWKAYLGSFAVKTHTNQKVKKATLWDGKGASLIQCTQQCAARDGCYGFNFCGNYCDLFRKKDFFDGLVSSDTCTVYLLRKVWFNHRSFNLCLIVNFEKKRVRTSFFLNVHILASSTLLLLRLLFDFFEQYTSNFFSWPLQKRINKVLIFQAKFQPHGSLFLQSFLFFQ